MIQRDMWVCKKMRVPRKEHSIFKTYGRFVGDGRASKCS